MNQETDRGQDPVCGMIVYKAIAPQAGRDGDTFYFCSDHCRQKFLAPAWPLQCAPGDENWQNQEME